MRRLLAFLPAIFLSFMLVAQQDKTKLPAPTSDTAKPAPVSPTAGYDDVAKADALYMLKKIKTSLATAVSPDEDTRAHRTNLVFLIDEATTIK